MKKYYLEDGKEVTIETLLKVLSREFTRIIPAEELSDHGIEWSNGKGSRLCNLAYSFVYASGATKSYHTEGNLEVPGLSEFMKNKPITKLKKVIGLFLHDTKKKDKVSRSINEEIKTKILKNSCVVCGSNSDLVCDHKNDLYNDTRLNNVLKQTVSDFQCLCTHCNLQKRQICKKEIEDCKLYSAKNIPSFKIYNFEFPWEKKVLDISDIHCKVGTYWYDPIQFNLNIFCYSRYVLPIVDSIKRSVKLIP